MQLVRALDGEISFSQRPDQVACKSLVLIPVPMNPRLAWKVDALCRLAASAKSMPVRVK